MSGRQRTKLVVACRSYHTIMDKARLRELTKRIEEDAEEIEDIVRNSDKRRPLELSIMAGFYRNVTEALDKFRKRMDLTVDRTEQAD